MKTPPCVRGRLLEPGAIALPPGEDLVRDYVITPRHSDTDDPGVTDAATISRFSASGHDQRRRFGKLVPITNLWSQRRACRPEELRGCHGGALDGFLRSGLGRKLWAN